MLFVNCVNHLIKKNVVKCSLSEAFFNLGTLFCWSFDLEHILNLVTDFEHVDT